MTKWDGIERRASMIDISLIKKDVDYIKQFIVEDRIRMKEHIDSSFHYRRKVDEIDILKNDLKEHKVSDRWIQGLTATTQISIIIMLVRLVLK